MLVSDVRAVLVDIQEAAEAGDSEKAHGMQDQLMVGVLEAVANGWTNGPKLAKEALKSVDIEFSRWSG